MTLHVPAIEQKVETNVLKWVQAKKTQERLDKKDLKTHVGPYLAISRETGACGSEIAKKVSQRLKWDLLDQEIVDYVEQHYGTPRCLIQRVDERHENWLSSIITSNIGGFGFSEATYTHRVAKLLLLAASHGDVVIVGRGARFILPRAAGFSVRVIAPMEFRVQQIMQQQGTTEAVAHRHVVDTDHDRDLYIKDHFGQTASDPHHYDLVLNLGSVSVDDAVETIIDAIKQNKHISG